jgi:hypothetical protein
LAVPFAFFASFAVQQRRGRADIRGVKIVLVLLFVAGCAPSLPAAIDIRGGPCEAVQFRAATAAELPAVPLHELVVAVNGRICHREGVPGDAVVYGELAALCAGASIFEPGSNLVEVALVPPGCGARRPVARRRTRCEAPEPD